MVALLSFINYLSKDSALYRAMNPKDEHAEWHTIEKTNAILADIFDMYVAAHTKKGRQAKTYPRPKKRQAIGSGAIPVSKFWDWWNEER